MAMKYTLHFKCVDVQYSTIEVEADNKQELDDIVAGLLDGPIIDENAEAKLGSWDLDQIEPMDQG